MVNTIQYNTTLQVILALRQAGIKYMVAPYESDAQLALLSKEGLVDVVISEDSDLLVYGTIALPHAHPLLIPTFHLAFILIISTPSHLWHLNRFTIFLCVLSYYPFFLIAFFLAPHQVSNASFTNSMSTAGVRKSSDVTSVPTRN